MSWILVVLYLIGLLVVGIAAARLLLRDADRLEAEVWLPVAFGLGLGVQCLAYLLSLLIFGQIYFWFLGIVCMGIVIAGAVYWRIPGREPFGGYALTDLPKHPGARTVFLLSAGLIVFYFTLLYVNAADFPFTSYDGRAIWSFKAKILYHDLTVFDEAFFDPLRVHYHRDYPLMIPFSEFTIYSMLDGIFERHVRFIFPTFFIFSVMFIFGILKRLGVGATLAIVMALIYCSTPFRSDWSERDGGALNSGAVDIPLSFFAMISIMCWYLWWKRRERWQILIGVIFGALCLMTKKEGIVILAVTTGANVLFLLFGHVRDRGVAAGKVAIGFLGTVLIAVPWFAIGRQMPVFYDEKYGDMITPEILTQVHTRLPIIGEFVIRDIVDIQKWSWFWIVFPLMLILAAPGWFKKRQFYLDSLLVAWILAYLFVFMVSPLNLVFHLNTAISRLLSHFLPLVIIRLALFFWDRNPFLPPGEGPEESPAIISEERVSMTPEEEAALA